ncbi:MAG: type II secretion system protein [Waddliaceae bacterium]
MYTLQKRFITLIEIVIVMFLIALITGVVAYNYSGTLEKGKEFKTKAGIEKLEAILNLAIAEDPELIENISANWTNIVNGSVLVQNPSALETDGWGKRFVVTEENGRIKVTSESIERYGRKQ